MNSYIKEYLPNTPGAIKYRQDIDGMLLAFGRIIMPQTFWAKTAKPHYEMERLLLDRSIKRLNIELPRGLSKSTIVAEIYPLYHIFMEEMNQPKLIIILSKSRPHALDRLQAIKDVLDFSKNFRSLFGYWGKNSAEWWRQDDIKLKDGSRIIAKGTGQQIRGIKDGYVRPTLIIGDDLEDENNTKTAIAMLSNLKWLLQGADYTLDTRYGRMIVIGTPIHQNCIVETLRNYPDWHSIKYKYLNEDENGKLYSIWEEVKSVEALLAEKKDKEEIGRVSIWYMERQCEITGDDDQLIRPEDILHWKGKLYVNNGKHYIEPEWIENREKFPNKIPVNVFMGVDPASSTSMKADYSVIFTIAYDADENVYCLPYFRKRVKPMNLADNIIGKFKEYRPLLTRIEGVGYQEMIADYLKREQVKEKLYIPGLEIPEKPRTSKSNRLETFQTRFARKKVFLLEGQEEFESELIHYPRASHDDLCDAFYYAQKRIYPPYHVIQNNDVKKKRRKIYSWKAL